MKIILSTLLTLSLLTGGVAFASDNESSGSKSGSSKKHSSGSHKSNRSGHRKKNGNVPSDK